MDSFKEEYAQAVLNRNPALFTELHFAALKNYRDIGETLIKNGADVNAKDHSYQKTRLIF